MAIGFRFRGRFRLDRKILCRLAGMLAWGWIALVHAAEPASTTFVVGGDFDYPPYEFLDSEGRPAGYNVELTRAIAETMGLDVRIRLGPWGEIRSALENGEIDAVHGMFYSRERAELVDFSTPHTIIYHSAFARRETPPIASVDDLRGKNLVVMRGDILHDFVVQNRLSENVVAVATQAEALRLLASGKHDYALAAKLPGIYWVRKLGLENIRPVGPAFLPSRYCYAVPKGVRPELLSAFNEGMAILNQNGRYSRIYDQWLGILERRDSVVPRRVLTGLLAVIGVLGLLLILAFAWNRSMRRQVARRTGMLTREIEERKAADSALRRWGQVFEHARWGVAVGSADGSRFELVNPHFAKIHGYEPEELQALSISAFLPPNSEAELRERIRIVHERGHHRYETRHRRKDGSLFPVAVDATAVRDANGRVAFRVVHLEDITERLAAEAALRESEARFRMLAETVREVFWLVSLDGGRERVLYISPAFRRVWGTDPEPFREDPRNLLRRVHPGDVDRVTAAFREFLRTETPFELEYRIVRADGEVRWIWDRGFRAGKDSDGRTLFSGLAQDVTEQKTAREEMDRLNRMLQTIRACDQALAASRSESEMLRAVCRTLVDVGGYRMAWVGYARDDEGGSVFPAAQWGDETGYLDAIRVSWLDRPEGRGPVGRAIRNGAVQIARDLAEDDSFRPWVRKALERGYRSCIAVPLFLDGNAFAALVLYAGETGAFDTAEQRLLEELAEDLAFGIAMWREREKRRLAQARMKESEARLRAVLEAVQVGIVVIDPHTHRIADANPAALRMIGAPLEDIKGRVCHLFLCSTQEGACPITDLKRKLDNEERELLTADGRRIPVLKTVVRMQMDGRDHLLESFVDISERKAAEAERETLIGELRTALSEIRRLRGFLPICASCKKIRDDEGYWHQIESYIRDRADVDFTHSICPDCQEKLYPELFEDEE